MRIPLKTDKFCILAGVADALSNTLPNVLGTGQADGKGGSGSLSSAIAAGTKTASADAENAAQSAIATGGSSGNGWQ